MTTPKHPDAADPTLVGSYPAFTKSGGGHVWDEVLEYRVWCHPERGAPDEGEGSDYFYAFATFDEAAAFSERTLGAEEPLVLIRQDEWISEPSPGEYEHEHEERITEWQVAWLEDSRRTATTISEFLAAGGPKKLLDRHVNPDEPIM